MDAALKAAPHVTPGSVHIVRAKVQRDMLMGLTMAEHDVNPEGRAVFWRQKR